jgi:broad specificity phosphatase PhoE
MPNIVQEAARSIITDLDPFESAVDIAIARGGRFLATLAESTLEARVGPQMTHSAIMSTLATVTALGEVRNNVINTRRELAITRVKAGLRETSFGSLPGCPPAEAKAEPKIAATA